jgi:hypothetical protein
MRDKSLDILLMALFGVSGIAILILAWWQPMPGLERILTIFIGIFGIGFALSRVPVLKSVKPRAGAQQIIKIEVEDNL